MTGTHDSLERSANGQFVQSPHEQFNAGEPAPPPDRSSQLLIIVFIDESTYSTDFSRWTGYVGVGDADPWTGRWRWMTDLQGWTQVAAAHPVVGLVVQVGGGTDTGPLTPSGSQWPARFIALSGAPRPIGPPLPGTLKVGLQIAVNKFQTEHGVEANIGRVAFFIDESGSMTRSDAGGAVIPMGRYLGEQPPDGLGVLDPLIYPPAGPEYPVGGVSYPMNERWLWWMWDVAALAFGEPRPSPWPFPPEP